MNKKYKNQQKYYEPVLDAYEKTLLDCMLGDQMLFWRQDGVDLSWGFLSPILDACETCGDRARQLHFYEAGRRGPLERQRLLRAAAALNPTPPGS